MKDYDKKNAIYQRGDEDFTFDFYTSLTARDKMNFVNFVTDSLIDDNYNYVLKDMIFDFGIIYIFTNVDVSYILSDECDDVVTAIEKFIVETNIVDIVVANAEVGVIDELRKAVDLNIEYKTGIHKNPISESLAGLLNTIERKVDGFNFDVDNTMEMIDMLSGISGELTMDKMLDAYAKSDMYRSNHNKVIEEKVKRNEINDVVPPVLSPAYEV